MRPLQALPSVKVPDGDVVLVKSREIILRAAFEMLILVECPVEGELAKARHWEIVGHVQKLLDPKAEAKLSIKAESRKSLAILAVMKNGVDVERACETLAGKTLKLGMSSLRLPVTPRTLCPPFTDKWRSAFSLHFDDCQPGCRPDTVRVAGLPIRWFAIEGRRREIDMALLREAFLSFGLVGQVHAAPQTRDDPAAPPPLHFEVFVLFETYEGFVTALASLHNRKLLMPGPDDRTLQAEIVISVDTTKYFSADSIRRREQEEAAKQAAAVEAQAEAERERRRQQWKEEEARLAKQREEEILREIAEAGRKKEEERLAGVAREAVEREARETAERDARVAAARAMRERIEREAQARVDEEIRLRDLALEAKARREQQLLKERRERMAGAAEARLAVDEPPASRSTSVVPAAGHVPRDDERTSGKAPRTRSRSGEDALQAPVRRLASSLRVQTALAAGVAAAARHDSEPSGCHKGEDADDADDDAAISLHAGSDLDEGWPSKRTRVNADESRPATTELAVDAAVESDSSSTASDDDNEDLSDGEVRDRVEEELRLRVLRKIKHLENRRLELLRERALQRHRASRGVQPGAV